MRKDQIKKKKKKTFFGSKIIKNEPLLWAALGQGEETLKETGPLPAREFGFRLGRTEVTRPLPRSRVSLELSAMREKYRYAVRGHRDPAGAGGGGAESHGGTRGAAQRNAPPSTPRANGTLGRIVPNNKKGPQRKNLLMMYWEI